MNPAVVSVVMSVYNGERFLASAIESVLNQTFTAFEFIVVNDGSTDGSAAIIESYRKADPRLQVYSQENRGLVESLNRGCTLAQGRYIARMDADDVSMRDRLLWQVIFMDEHPEVGLLGGAIEYIDANDKVVGAHYPASDHQTLKSALFQVEGTFCHPATIMRTTHFAASGGYRKAFLDAEDYDLWLRMTGCCQLANLQRVVLKYRIHANQVSQRKLKQQALSLLAARQIFASPSAGSREILGCEDGITPALLEGLGVGEREQQRFLATRHRNSICTLAMAGDIPAALQAWTNIRNGLQWAHLERSFVAHLWLIKASLYWRQRRWAHSLVAVGRAVTVWPKVAGRPLRYLLSRLGSEYLGKDQSAGALG